MFSAGEDLLDDTDSQSVKESESDSAESKEQHDACVRGHFLWKWKSADYAKYLTESNYKSFFFFVTRVKIRCFH